jgi:hypothetical protein
MAQEPATAQPMNGALLEQLLRRARSEAAFRDRLLQTPEDVLTGAHIRPDPKWLRFFSRLAANNFESGIQHKIDNDPTGEAEAEA